jgi:hypothetical protein
MTAVDFRWLGTAEDRARALVAEFTSLMPADIAVHRYVVSGANVSGQINAGFHAESAARLRRIADKFDLAYTETKNGPDRLDLSARGVINGVNVRFWDDVPNPSPSMSACCCNCHGGAA